MKTIKQIADEIGVSKQAVFKKIDKLGLRKQLSKVYNQWLIDKDAENTIKSAFWETNKTATDSTTGSRMVDSLVAMLQKELEAKNEQISHLQKLLDQEQQLRMVTEQKLLLLENQQGDQNQRPDVEGKKSFFSRIFKQ